MKRRSLLAILLLIMMLVSAACGGADPAAQNEGEGADTKAESEGAESEIKGEITFITHRTDLVDTFYKEAIQRFKEKYPDVKAVHIEALKDYEGDIKVRMSSQAYGDVLFISPSISRDQYPDFFAPLDDLGLNGKIHFQDLFSYDGKLYGITSGVNAEGIVYNKAAFEKAGIETVPSTLDELYEAAEKLKNAGIVPLATNFKDAWPLQQWDKMATMIAKDGGYHNSLIETDTPFTMDSPYGKSFQILNTFIENGWTEPDLMGTDWESSKTKVANGEYAMYFLANWVINQVIDQGGADPENIGFFPFPVDNSGTPVSLYGQDWSYGVNKHSKNIETAKAFVKFMVEESGYEDISGFIPVLKDKESNLPQLSEFMSYDPEIVYPEPTDPQFSKVANGAKIDFYGGRYIQDLFLSDKSLEEGMNALNERWAAAREELGLK